LRGIDPEAGTPRGHSPGDELGSAAEPAAVLLL